MALDCKSVWAGALTDTSVRVVADTAPPTNGSLLVADNEAMTGAVTIGPVTATINGILDFSVTGLDPDTQYWYVVDAGGLNVSYKGTFRTHPGAAGEPLSYIFGAAGDAGLVGAGNDSYITSAVSNNPVFDTMRLQCAAEGWAWFSHLGDLHYRNYNVNDPGLFRAAYDENHNFNLGFNPAARQGMFLRGQAITYVWDDHDFGGNDSNRTVASNPAANLAYRECVPHYPLGSGGSTGIYQSWQVGRVLYVATDSRSFRDPNSAPQTPSKTLLGTAQKAWFENLLTTARNDGAEALVWQSSSRWIGGTDTFSSFEHERAELVQMFGDTGWLNRMIFMTADEHALSVCSGPYNPYGRFPMFMFASMDSSYGTNSTAIYDVGQNQGRQQYGTMRVADNGHTISLTGTGYINGSVWKAYTKHVHVGGTLIALDYTAGDVSEPFEPTDDDQKVRNEITASRVDGGEYTYSKLEGPNNVNDPAEDPDGIGVYDEGVQLNVATDEQLPDMASWRVHLGTADEDRYPSVRIDLAKNPDLADAMTGLYLGDRITVATPPPWMAPDTINLIAEGGTETIGHPNDWDVVLNASPGSPWIVAQLPASAASAGPNRPNRLDTARSQLVNAVGAADTELIVHTVQNGIFDRAPWIISAGLADAGNLKPTQFPFDLKLGGEVVRATAIKPLAYDSFTRTVAAGSWGTSDGGQAWTLVGGTTTERSVDGSRGLVNLPSAPSTLRFQLLPTAVGDCDIRTRLSVDQVATGASMVPGVLLRYNGTSAYYRARIHFGVSGGMFASVTRDTTQVGGTPTLPYTYAALDEFELRVRLIGHRILMRVWRVAAPEPHIWHHDQEITANTIAAGQVGCTASAFAGLTNVSPNIRFDRYEVITPQRVTVTRSINTVVKAQAAGTAVSLAQPATVAL